MKAIGALKIQKLKKQVTNEADWCPKNQEIEKNRSPMKRIGALKIQISEKQVTNKVDWCPKNPDIEKIGHQ